jgi:NAD(P)H-hydrate epimerase
MLFTTPEGKEVPSLSTDQMREVDRIAVEAFGLGLLQMMENAGRNLAEVVLHQFPHIEGTIVVLAGPGGNGGGGLCAARHLHNHGLEVELILAKPLIGQAAQNQLNILENAGISVLEEDDRSGALQRAYVVLDALIGYSLRGAPRGNTAKLIQLANQLAQRIVSLDIPSGVDATTGETPGIAIYPQITVTLALPKSGLAQVEGEVILADIGIPLQVYKTMGLDLEPFFGDKYWIPLEKVN